MTHTYQQPKVLREWALDVPNGELYQCLVYDNGSVCSAVGRYAHSSGSSTCTWAQFLAGSLNDTVGKTMGAQTLSEALAFVSDIHQG